MYHMACRIYVVAAIFSRTCDQGRTLGRRSREPSWALSSEGSNRPVDIDSRAFNFIAYVCFSEMISSSAAPAVQMVPWAACMPSCSSVYVQETARAIKYIRFTDGAHSCCKHTDGRPRPPESLRMKGHGIRMHQLKA